MSNEVVTTLVCDDQLQARLEAATTDVMAYAEQAGTSLAEVGAGYAELGHAGEEAGQSLIASAQATQAALKQSAETAERVTGSHHGLYRAELAIAHGTELLGKAVATQNAALGEGIEHLGGTIQVVGIASHSYGGLKTVIDSVRNSQIALNLVSGPMGWAALAAAAVAAGAAYLYFSSSAEEAKKSQEELNEEAKKFHDERLKDLTLQEEGPIAVKKAGESDLPKEKAAVTQAGEEMAEANTKYAEAVKKRKEIEAAPNYGGEGARRREIEEAQAKEKEALDATTASVKRLADAHDALTKTQATLADNAAAAKLAEEAKVHEKLVEHINEEAKALERKARALQVGEPAAKREELAGAATDPAGKAALTAYDTAEAHLAAAEASKKAAHEEEEYGKKVSALMERIKEETIAVRDGGEAKEEAAIKAMHLAKADEDAAIAAAKVLAAEREKVKAQKEAEALKKSEEKAQDSRAEQITKAMMTPAEKYKEQIKEIDALEKLHHENRMRGIDEETAARARQAVAKEYMDAAMKGDKGGEHTGQFEDLKAAYRRISTAAAGGGHDPQKEIAEHTKKMEGHLAKLAGKSAQHSEHRQPKARMGA